MAPTHHRMSLAGGGSPSGELSLVFSLQVKSPHGSSGYSRSLHYYTLPGWIPSLRLPIYIDNIHNAKHGSDLESYDTEGRFAPYKFDDIFSKYATKHPNKVTFMEIQCMLKANRNSIWILQVQG